MVPQGSDPGGCYKRTTALLCACNLIAVFCILYALFTATSSSLSATRVSWYRPQAGSRSTDAEVARLQESFEARRRAMEPVELIKRVKEIQEESSRAEMRNLRSATARKKYAADLSERLKQLKEANATKNQEALEEWQRKKIEFKRNVGRIRNKNGQNRSELNHNKPTQVHG